MPSRLVMIVPKFQLFAAYLSAVFRIKLEFLMSFRFSLHAANKGAKTDDLNSLENNINTSLTWEQQMPRIAPLFSGSTRLRAGLIFFCSTYANNKSIS
jgi:hypothetical protein